MFTLYFDIRGRSRNMTLLYLCTLCFCIAGIHMGVVGSNMCDDGWVYNSNTETCLQATSDMDVYYFLYVSISPCLDKTGGEFRNISGHVVEFTETIEPFLRKFNTSNEVIIYTILGLSEDYGCWLQELDTEMLMHQPIIYYLQKSIEVKGNELESEGILRHSGKPMLAEILHRLGFNKETVKVITQNHLTGLCAIWSMFIDIPHFCVMSPGCPDYLQFMKVPAAGVDLSRWLEDSLLTRNCYSRFTDDENVRTYFVPGKPVPFQAHVSDDAPIICQVTAGPIEPPVCPRDVKLVSVSNRNATLSWSPGQLGRELVVEITVQICDGGPVSCEYFTKITFEDVSLFELKNYTVSGLQPNKIYKLVLQIQSDKFETKDCNVTLALQTNEFALDLQTNEGQESNAAVVGLSVMFSISLCVCSVLAILLFRHYQQDKKDKNSDIDKIVAKVMKQTTSNQEVKLQVHKDPETNCAMYLNVQAEPHEYEQTIENQDNHIYEM